MSDQPSTPDIDRIRERRVVVLKLIDEEKRRQASPDPHVRAALAEVAKGLLAEKRRLTEDLLAGLRALLDATTDRVAKGLGLSEQNAEGYRGGTRGAVEYALQELDRKRGVYAQEDPEVEIKELDKAIVGQRDLLRWIGQAKGG